MQAKEQAEDALAEYDAAHRAGGEMEYPQWAADVLKACEEVERITERVHHLNYKGN